MNLNSLIRSLTIVSGAMLVQACDNLRCTYGEGAVETTTLSVEQFHGIVVAGSMDVLLEPGSEQEVLVKAESNIAALMKAEVNNGICTLSTKGCYMTDEGLHVTIRTTGLDRVALEGSGNIKGAGVLLPGEVTITLDGSGDIELDAQGQQLYAGVQGSGDITLKGMCAALDAEVLGSGEIHAEALQAQDATVNVTGSGDIDVQVVGTLDATVTGSGDIRYHGKPAQLDKSVDGSGDIKKAK